MTIDIIYTPIVTFTSQTFICFIVSYWTGTTSLGKLYGDKWIGQHDNFHLCLSLINILSILTLTPVASLTSIININNLNYPWENIESLGIHLFVSSQWYFGGFTTFCWRGYRNSLNCKLNNKNVMIHLFEYILVSCLVYNPFTNVTLEDIYKQLHILGGSLKGHCEQNPWSDDKNYHKSQAVVDINMLELFTKSGTEFSSSVSTLTLST